MKNRLSISVATAIGREHSLAIGCFQEAQLQGPHFAMKLGRRPACPDPKETSGEAITLR